MTKNNVMRTFVMCSVMAGSSLMFAQAPTQNIDSSKHPHLAAAQSSIAQAYQQIETSQQGYHEHLGGHVEKAKQLLAQASQELKAAAEYANAHHHK
jgi:hypothetical protein